MSSRSCPICLDAGTVRLEYSLECRLLNSDDIEVSALKKGETMKEYFELNHTTRIIFGNGVSKKTGEEVKRFGCKRVLILCDRGVEVAGIVDRVTVSLKQERIDYEIFNKVRQNPRDVDCEEAAELAKSMEADAFIGIGGGSSMDCAKAVNVLTTNGGDCQKWSEIRKWDRNVLPLFCVPTTAGTGSEVTFEAVITNSRSNVKISISYGNKLAPSVAVMDPELTVSLPPLLTASTGMDALTHAIEAYTCNRAQPLTDGLALQAMEFIGRSLARATHKGKDLDARAGMLFGSMIAGIAFTNSYLGAVHSLSETIGGFYDTPHGIANAIFLPLVTQHNLASDYRKHSNIARLLQVKTEGATEVEAAKMAAEKLFELNRDLGIPRFSQVSGVDPKDFELIAKRCVSHPCTKGNPRLIGYEEYLAILNSAYKGDSR